ncbi:MAG: hypothetical protein WCE82_01740 [Halobacteriota archaeon]
MKLDLDPRKAGPKASNTFEISKRNASHCIDGGHGFSGKVMLFEYKVRITKTPLGFGSGFHTDACIKKS